MLAGVPTLNVEQYKFDEDPVVYTSTSRPHTGHDVGADGARTGRFTSGSMIFCLAFTSSIARDFDEPCHRS